MIIRARKVAQPPATVVPRSYSIAWRELVHDLEGLVSHALEEMRARQHPHDVAELFGLGLEAHDHSHDAWIRFRLKLERAYSGSMESAGQQEFVGMRLKKRFAVKHTLATVMKADLDVPPNPWSLAWIRTRGGDKIRQASDQQKELVRDIVSRGYAAGARPEQMAESLKRVIGLTTRQAQAVEKRRQDAIDETADETFANGIADDYAEKQLAYRVETIARTENAVAREQGRKDSWRVAATEGDLPTTAKRRWVSFPSGPRLCDDCADMNDQTVGLDEPFQSDEYGEVEPGQIHPDCRCTQVLEFDS